MKRPGRRFVLAALLSLVAVGVEADVATQRHMEGEDVMNLIDLSGHIPEAAFFTVNDDVMGGVSSSQVSVEQEAVIFAGTVRLENNGGFASMRGSLARADLRRYDGVELVVRGDGRRYKLTLRDDRDSPIRYQASFETRPSELHVVRLPFARFEAWRRGRTVPEAAPLALGRLQELGVLVGDAQAGDFRLELRAVRAYRDVADEG